MSDSILTLKTRNHQYSVPIPPYWSMLDFALQVWRCLGANA